MKALTALLLVLLLAGLVVGSFAVWMLSPAQQQAITQRAASDAAKAAADLQAQQQRTALDLQASQDNAAWWHDLRQNLTPLLLLVVGVLAGCLIIGTCGAVAIALTGQWDERRKRAGVYYPDKRALLPVTPAALDTAAVISLTGHHAAQLEAARRPAFSGQARNERLTITQGAPAAQALQRPPVELPAPAAPQALPGPTALSNVLTWTPDLSRVLIGLDPAGRPLVVSARDLCHVALVGATGGGKSNAMRLLLGQLLAAGAKAILIDPHYSPHDPDDPTTGDWTPIEHRLYRPPAVLPAEMSATFDWLSQELDERLARRRHGERSGPPLFVAIDELPSIVSKVDQAPDVLTAIVREGRKVGLLAITSSQDFLVKSIGTGSAARDNFRTAIYAGGDQVSARVLLDVKARDIPESELGRGVVMLRSQATPTAGLARLPLVTDSDLHRLLPAPARDVSDPTPRRPSLVELVNPPRPALRVVRPDEDADGIPVHTGTAVEPEFEPETEQNEASVLVRTSTPADDDPRARRVVELFKQGVSRNSICTIIYGGKSPRTLREVNRILTEAGLLSDQAADGD